MKPVLAANISDTAWGEKTLGNTFPDVATLINKILKNSLTIASIILLGLLIFGGIAFIINAGGGDQKKAAQGKAAVTNALIGFAIVLLAYSIVLTIQFITGVKILNSDL